MNDRIAEIKANNKTAVAVAVVLRDLDDIRGQRTVRSNAADIIDECNKDSFYLLGEIERLTVEIGKCTTLNGTYIAMEAHNMAMRAAKSEIDRLTAERDAAVADLKLHGGCPTCEHRIGNPPHNLCKCFCIDNETAYIRCLSYEWRGPEGMKDNADKR